MINYSQDEEGIEVPDDNHCPICEQQANKAMEKQVEDHIKEIREMETQTECYFSECEYHFGYEPLGLCTESEEGRKGKPCTK